MEIVKLFEVAEIIAGQSPLSETYNSNGIGLPFFQGKSDFGYQFPTPRIWCSKPLKVAKPLDILMSVRAPVGCVNINMEDSCIGRGIMAVRPYKLAETQAVIHQKYLYYYFIKHEEQIEALGTGSTFKAIKKSELENLEIPLPDLATQKKIAAVLDKADELLQYNKQLIEQYDTLTQSLFLDMFGDPVRNEKGWEKKKLKIGINKLQSGLSLSGEEREVREGELAVLKISAITTGVFLKNECKVVKQSDIQKDIIYVKKGDLLFSRANTKEKVGAVAIVNENHDNLFLPDKLWRIDTTRLLGKIYLKFLLGHSGFRKNIEKVSTGTSGSMVNISMSKFMEIDSPFPPIELQNQFAERVQLIEQQKEQAQQALQKSEDLFNSLLQKAFKGELVPEYEL